MVHSHRRCYFCSTVGGMGSMQEDAVQTVSVDREQVPPGETMGLPAP